MSEDVRSKVSLNVLLAGMTDEEGVELPDQVLPSVLVLAVLDVIQVLNATASLLQDAINQEERVGHQFCITLCSSHDLEEQSEVVLSLIFLFLND